MQITVTPTAIDVLDADLLTALSVLTELRAEDTERVLVEDGLARAGMEPSPGHIWLDVAALAHRAAPPDDAAWRERYEAMIDYAASKGWTDADRSVVRAHLEVAP